MKVDLCAEMHLTRDLPSTSGLRLLLLGPSGPSQRPANGPRRAFARLLEHFRESGAFHVSVLDSQRPEPSSDPIRRWIEDVQWRLTLLVRVALRLGDTHAVMLNASTAEILKLGPWLWLAARLGGTPLVVRAFGGGLDTALARTSALRRVLCRYTVLRAPLLLLQSRTLCDRVHTSGVARWLPPTRDLCDEPSPTRTACQRFLFLAELRQDKGIETALAASGRLPEGCSLTVAGPCGADFDVARLEQHPRAEWIGEVDAGAVARLMREHDVLVHPSWSDDEGLPGAVLEALQCGLPVVAARAGAIEELVQHGTTGLLVAPRSEEELGASMELLARDSALFSKLAHNARLRGQEFGAGLWHAELEDWLFQVCDQGTVARTTPFYDRAEFWRPKHLRRRQTA